MKRGLVFGSFDCFHSGHQWFLKEAKKHCDHLTAIVATDEDILQRKSRAPMQGITTRLDNVNHSGVVDSVKEGDAKQGEWSMFNNYSYDIVCVGYDQHQLLAALQSIQHQYAFTIIQLTLYHPQRYKSSLYVRS